MTSLVSSPKKARLLAVCHTCQKKHAISLDEILHTDAIRDWEVKHSGHRIEFLDPEAYERSIANHAVHDYKHNADVKIAYGSTTAYTITLAGLAESATRVAGRESNSVVNTSNLYLDYMIAGYITTGTSPTANEIIDVCAVGANSSTPVWPDVFDGTDSAETITSTNIKNHICRFVASIAVASTSDVAYPFGPISLAQLFGVCPTHHVLFVSHSTDVNLNATGGNHVINYIPVYATVT